MMCDKCGCFEVFFKQGQRDKNGLLIPFERNGTKHDCDFTEIFPCARCGEQVYLDKKVLSRGSNKRRVLNAGSLTYHFCSKDRSK